MSSTIRHASFRFGVRHLEFPLPITFSSVCVSFSGLLDPKMGWQPLEFRFHVVYKPRYEYFHFNGHHLEFPLPVAFVIIAISFVGFPTPKKGGGRGSRWNFDCICTKSRDTPGGYFYSPLPGKVKRRKKIR